MKNFKYYLASFGVVLLLSISVQAIAQMASPEAVQSIGTKDKIFALLEDINALNIVLVIVATFFGGAWYKGREKIRQVSDLLEKVYEYTDEHSESKRKFSPREMKDIVQRVLAILGKAPVVQTSSGTKPVATKVDEKKKFTLKDKGKI